MTHAARSANPSDIYPRRTDIDGRPLCRYCGKPLSGRRTSWCSKECETEAMIRCMPSVASSHVRDRDNGVCVICGERTEEKRYVCRRWWELLVKIHGRQYAYKFVQYLRKLGWPADENYFIRRWWEADHITPVIEGGGLCGLDNYRTLCVPCHKKETAKLARRRAEKRKKQLKLDLEQL